MYLEQNSTTQTGITSMELLVTLAIIAIVVSTGIAAFGDYTKRSNDEYGKSAIEKVLSEQRFLYVQSRSFTTNFTDLGYASNSATSEQDYFDLSLSTCGAGVTISRCVKVTATPKTNKTTGTTFSADTSGVKTPADRW